MDQGRDRRRAGHGVGQPDVERNLRALADRAEEEKKADRRQKPVLDAAGGRDLRDLGEIDAPEIGEHQEHGDEETEVSDAVDDEGLLAGGRSVVGLVVEADEEVGAEPDSLPSDEHQEIARSEDQDEHLGEEEVQVGEVAAEPMLVGHVADRVKVDEEADPGDDHQHDHAEWIELEGEIGADGAGGDPVVDEIDVPLAGGIGGVVLHDGNRPGDGGAEGGQQRHGGHETLAEALAEQAVQQKAGERQEGDEPEFVEHGWGG